MAVLISFQLSSWHEAACPAQSIIEPFTCVSNNHGTNVRAITVKMLIEIQAIYKPLQFLELQTQEVRKEDSQFADSSASFDHTEKSHSPTD